MQSSELVIGRTFGIIIEHLENFIVQLNSFCDNNNVKQGYVPSFVGAFRNLEIVGTSKKLPDKEIPDYSSIYLEYAEVIGAGTISYDENSKKRSLHVHLSAGLRTQSSTAYTGHFLNGEVQYLLELYLVEVLKPSMTRIINKDIYNIPIINFI